MNIDFIISSALLLTGITASFFAIKTIIEQHKAEHFLTDSIFKEALKNKKTLRTLIEIQEKMGQEISISKNKQDELNKIIEIALTELPPRKQTLIKRGTVQVSREGERLYKQKLLIEALKNKVD